MRYLGFLVVCSQLMGGCMAHHTSGQRLMDAARELNDATRFGRMRMAANLTASGAEQSFLERRQTWGNDLRVVNVDVTAVDFDSESEAEVTVQIAWTHMAEGILHNTTLEQSWKDHQPEGWKLTRERRVRGAAGLFGEVASRPRSEPRPDVHFPSKTLTPTEAQNAPTGLRQLR